jgi:ABC-type lipoprotein export system ATPase subunit
MQYPFISVENLQVIYNQNRSNEVRSLGGVSLNIYPNEYLIIHGPSGCGKTTLLCSIAGLQSPTSGEVLIQGKKISAMNEDEKAEVHQHFTGMIFQAFYLIPSLSVIDNVCLPGIFCGKDPDEIRVEGMKLLHRFGILEQADKLPGELSGGQKQRVAIARALINNPQVVLADEPVGNLDSDSAQNVLQILKELNEVDKKTVIMVTHNEDYLRYGSRVINMKDGKIDSIVVNEKSAYSEAETIIRPVEVNISNELKILSRTFKNLSYQQLGALLVPFKVKQFMSYLLSELTEEQSNMAENLMKEVLFGNINTEMLGKKLDLKFEEGGANWNKMRAQSFSVRVGDVMKLIETIKNHPEKALSALEDHLVRIFSVHLADDARPRFFDFLKARMENKIDFEGLRKYLDQPKSAGGVGLHATTAEKLAREVEIIMLLKYSA